MKDKVVIIGLGYVGLPLAILVKKKGYQITGIVKNIEKAKLINNHVCPFKDKKNSLNIKKYPISATTDYKVVSDADIIIICVPTPIDKKNYPDFTPIISASKNIAKYIKNNALVILESTVNPGATKKVLISTIEKFSKLKAGVDFEVSHCPERINPGDEKWNVENIPRVIGSLTKKGLQKTYLFYKSILKGKITKMKSIEEAEAVKIVENSFRDINIAFVNELAMSFNKIGINILNVIKGASTKPYAFLPHYPGCGVGGHCIPVDPYYLIDYARKLGFEHKFLSLARKINNNMPEYTVNILKEAAKNNEISIKDLNVAVLGLAYKDDIDDDRESPAYEIIKHLKINKIKYDIFDPYLIKKSTANSLEKVLVNKNAVIIATGHKIFKKLKPNNLKGVKIVIDGRNCLNKTLFIKEGLYYQGIGIK